MYGCEGSRSVRYDGQVLGSWIYLRAILRIPGDVVLKFILRM